MKKSQEDNHRQMYDQDCFHCLLAAASACAVLVWVSLTTQIEREQNQRVVQMIPFASMAVKTLLCEVCSRPGDTQKSGVHCQPMCRFARWTA